MDFRQLNTFLEIHRRGSFLGAAGSLGLTQPALSRQIARLEREIGRPLFVRGSRRVRLTPTGEELLPRAVEMLDLWRETLSALSNEPTAQAGSYSISAGGIVAAYVLPRTLQNLRRSKPGVTFRVLEGDAERTREAVLSGETDLGVLSGPVDDRELQTRFLFRDRIIPVVGAKHALAKRRRLTVAAIADEDFVLFHPASAIRTATERSFRRLRPAFRPRAVMELRSVESVIKSLEAGVGVGFLSELALSPRLARLELPELFAERDFYFCFRKSRPGMVALVEALMGALPHGLPGRD